MVEVEQQRLDAFPDDETDALLDDTDRVELMERAIETLKPDDQMLLNLYYFDNRPIDWPSPSEVLKVKSEESLGGLRP